MSAADKAKNKGQAVKGRAKEVVGRVSGDRSMEAEGIGDQAAGNLKQAGEKVKDSLRSIKQAK